MSEPEGSNNPTDIPNPTDSAPAPPSEPGPSAPAAQAPGAQAPLPTGVNPQASAAQPGKTVFGLGQDANYHQPPQNVVFADDYEKRFAVEDPYGEETAPNARIWRVYNEEAAAYDAVYVGQARDGLDVMLVFAGLFSAVVTSFLVQVSQSLQADYTAMSAILLHDLVSVQLSIAGSPSSLQNITAPSINPLQTFRPDSITVWVNGLWVVSLTMSLVVALSAVLVKQWFHHYTSIPSGTPGARSHLRQYRFDGLQKWRVKVIIGLLPIIMHISLVLFLVGLLLFFIPLCTSLACVVGVITIVLCLLYLASSALPIFFPQCPYQTPLTDFIYHTGLPIKNASHPLLGYLQRLIKTCQAWIHHHLFCRGLQFKPSWDSHTSPEALSTLPDPSKGSSVTLSALEMVAVTSNIDRLSVNALDWLFNVSSNPTVHSLVVQAIAGLPLGVQKYAQATLASQEEMDNVRKHLYDYCNINETYTVWERLTRSRCFYQSDYTCGTYSSSMLSPNFDNPCFKATMLDATGKGNLQKFFYTHYNYLFHPIIWKNLIQSLLEIDSNYFQVQSLGDLASPDYAHILSLLLPAYAGKARDEVSIPRRTGSNTVLLHEALTYHLGDMSKAVQDRLLEMLSSIEDDLAATLPPHYRVLYKAAKFALHYLPDEFRESPRGGGSCCWHVKLLSGALQSLAEEYNTILVKHSGLVEAILELLCTIIDDTSLCEYTAAGMDLPYASVSAIGDVLRATALSRQPNFVFPSFHRLVQPADYLSEGLEGPARIEIFDLIDVAFEIGTKETYQAFIDGEWLWMLAERYIVKWDETQVQPIFAFIYGLQALDPALARTFLDYLQEPRNFAITFIMIATHNKVNEDVLLKLCPKGSSAWDTHRSTLDGLIDWCQASNGHDLPSLFKNCFNGKVVKTEKGTVSLDEALQKIITQDRRSVERAARTMIILGETAPWPDEY